jgi:hypothetical protein
MNWHLGILGLASLHQGIKDLVGDVEDVVIGAHAPEKKLERFDKV